jgi:hypothetical protein
MRDEHEALQSSATRVRGSVWGRSNEMPSLAVVLSPFAELIEGRINATAINEVHWGGATGVDRYLVTLPRAGVSVGASGVQYNASLMKDEMETFWS